MMACGTSRRNKKVLLYLIFCVAYICLLYSWTGHLKTRTKNGTSACSSSNHTPATILLWHWPFGKAYPLNGNVCWNLYKIPGCKVVDQHSEFLNADIVVFHQKELALKKQKLPLNLARPLGQRWLWMSLEAPQNHGNLSQFANLFNLTMSYRRDADITLPYGELQPQDGEIEDFSMNKTNLLCWVVSNFKSRHKRSEVYRELSAFVKITVYGRWKNARLPSASLLPTISRCYFYLAFENSISKDYITEKLWRNSYLGGAIPVVLGPPVEDYKAVAPPHSFIHVDDFASVKELGTYLQELAADRERYQEFFRWRQKWKVKLNTDWRERLCKICTKYHCLPQQKVYSDLDAWNNG
ncbi:alpha-(1,3)-fucosyltransferase 7 [Boleophthalmus pectinirostris]|uniref:alpha-(1,3)-fucosyltransferase 7 n=1 Tax=Boleophthalmus pectinirostris TaxID=150288 RepID=UPI000A1C5EAD|nr:alpha-(1,3)-fucosyltransferase 7 [Boleophthalmus pectinirostris]